MARGDVIYQKKKLVISSSHHWYWRPRWKMASNGGVSDLWWFCFYLHADEKS